MANSPFNLRKRTKVAAVSSDCVVGFTFISVHLEDASFVICWLIYGFAIISSLFGFS